MYPFLKLPKPVSAAPAKGPQFKPPKVKTPGVANAYFADKVQSKLTNLEVTFDNQSQTIQLTDEGLSPERTLVIETYGRFDELTTKDNVIPGFRPYFGYEGESLNPSEDIYTDRGEGRKHGTVPNFYYFSAINKSALDELISYWNAFKKNPNSKLPRGLNWLRGVFDHIKDIRYWSAQDRITEDLLDNWRFRVEISTNLNEQIPFYTELWFSKSEVERSRKERLVRKLIEQSGGITKKVSMIPEISYHAISGTLPIKCVKDLLDSPSFASIDLFKWDGIMYFQPSGQCVAPTQYENGAVEEELQITSPPQRPLPKVALFDGYPLTSHDLLNNRLIVDDPDNFSEGYEPETYIHGTGMCSLIALGDASSTKNKPLDRPIYVRPIMQPVKDPVSGLYEEKIPEDEIPIDLVHRAVRRMYEESDFGEPPAAPHVRVINLSIGDLGRPFIRQVSPWAKLIDWLSYTYNVVFVVSAGNHTGELQLDITTKEFNALSAEDKEAMILKAMDAQKPLRRLLSPAEAINAITVGAVHEDDYDGAIHPAFIDPFVTPCLPSPINPLSWGHQRSIKPNLLMPGGRVVFTNSTLLDTDPVVLKLRINNIPPGQKVASPLVTSGRSTTSAVAYTSGTSNAAALATRELELLRSFHEPFFNNSGFDEKYEAVFLKALINHGGQYGDERHAIEKALKGKKKLRKEEAAKYLGYGKVINNRIYTCKSNQATAIQCGEMKVKDSISYKFPLPASLSKQELLKRLIITLAWLSPINPSSDTSYRGAKIKFDYKSSKQKMGVSDLIYEHNMIEKGTVAHGLLEGDDVAQFIDGESLEIKLDSSGIGINADLMIPYALVVTIDTPGSEDLNIYQEVKEKLDRIHAEEGQATLTAKVPTKV